MAYIQHIHKNTADSHQVSPAYLLTFLRWSNRDTQNFSDADFLDLRKPMLVINDCISLQVTSSKTSHIHQASMIMIGGDINYSTALAPGDFVLINMLDDDGKLLGKGGTPDNPTQDSLYSRAKNLKPINKKDDGFKGIFKIQSVRRNLKISENGIKIFVYQITAAAFTEFNQVIYFNPYLFSVGDDKLGKLGVINASASEEYRKSDRDPFTMRSAFKSLIGFLIGQGFGKNFTPQGDGVVRNHNKNFLIPKDVGSLLGVNKSNLLAADIFRYYTGIEKYSYGTKKRKQNKNDHSQIDEKGLNPVHSKKGAFYDSGESPSGSILIQPEPWCQVTAWSILNQYSNSLINEMYTVFRTTPDGSIMPCVVYRQKPFNSSIFAKKNSNIKCTEFLSLPRWQVDGDLITDISLGRDEVARINFVHIIGKTRFTNTVDHVANQAAFNSQIGDSEDIKRNGLKPIITSCDFDFPQEKAKSLSPIWNALCFDWMNNGHLKENGTIVCEGIYEPICIGDNLQLDRTVFHIESISHDMSIAASGHKNFRTTIQVSHGVDERTDTTYKPIYPEMEHTDMGEYLKDDYERGDKLFPGISDSQDIADRDRAEKLKSNDTQAFNQVNRILKKFKKVKK